MNASDQHAARRARRRRRRASTSAAVGDIGFSQSTCLPASSARDRPLARAARSAAGCRRRRPRGRRAAPRRSRARAGCRARPRRRRARAAIARADRDELGLRRGAARASSSALIRAVERMPQRTASVTPPEVVSARLGLRAGRSSRRVTASSSTRPVTMNFVPDAAVRARPRPLSIDRDDERAEEGVSMWPRPPNSDVPPITAAAIEYEQDRAAALVRVDRAAARGEHDAADAGHQRADREAGDLDAVHVDARAPRGLRVAADRVDVAAERVRLSTNVQNDEERDDDERRPTGSRGPGCRGDDDDGAPSGAADRAGSRRAARVRSAGRPATVAPRRSSCARRVERRRMITARIQPSRRREEVVRRSR